MTRAVMEQTTMVSMKGPSMATAPSRIISLVRAAAWAMGADPSPASLLNTPRATPFWMVRPESTADHAAPGGHRGERIAENLPRKQRVQASMLKASTSSAPSHVEDTHEGHNGRRRPRQYGRSRR